MSSLLKEIWFEIAPVLSLFIAGANFDFPIISSDIPFERKGKSVFKFDDILSYLLFMYVFFRIRKFF